MNLHFGRSRHKWEDVLWVGLNWLVTGFYEQGDEHWGYIYSYMKFLEQLGNCQFFKEHCVFVTVVAY